MILLSKIKASTLQFAILISALIGFLLLSFITLTYTQTHFKIQSNELIERVTTLDASFFISEQNIEEDVDIQAGYWGAFQKRKATVNHGQSKLSKIALIGGLKQSTNPVLYLADNNNPLVLVGNTQINGAAVIPSSGVKPGSIAGEYYANKNLINGTISYSNNALPRLDNRLKDYCKSLFNKNNFDSLTIVNGQALITNSFDEAQKIVYSEKTLRTFEKIVGHVRLQSNKEIIIAKESEIQDPLLVAPIVRIESGFSGNLHIVATDSIIIEKNVQLNYPSSIVLSTQKEESAIRISEGSAISGIIYFLQDDVPTKPTLNIELENNSKVFGDIYCQGYLELSGVVEGTVYTRKFMTRASGSNYINHILNGKITPVTQEGIIGIPMFNQKTAVVQWLY